MAASRTITDTIGDGATWAVHVIFTEVTTNPTAPSGATTNVAPRFAGNDVFWLNNPSPSAPSFTRTRTWATDAQL